MKKLILILALIPIFASGQANKPKLNLESIKYGNKTRNKAILTAFIGSAFAYWGTQRENGKPMVFIGLSVASISIPMTIKGNNKINKEIKKFD